MNKNVFTLLASLSKQVCNLSPPLCKEMHENVSGKWFQEHVLCIKKEEVLQVSCVPAVIDENKLKSIIIIIYVLTAKWLKSSVSDLQMKQRAPSVFESHCTLPLRPK